MYIPAFTKMIRAETRGTSIFHDKTSVKTYGHFPGLVALPSDKITINKAMKITDTTKYFLF